MLAIVSTKVELSRNSVCLFLSQVVLEGLKYKFINHTCTCPTRGSSFYSGKVTALGVLFCFAWLFVDLACFFLSSFSSLYTEETG